MSINKNWLLSFFLIVILSSCDLFGDNKDDKSKVSIKIDGEEIEVLGSSSMLHKANATNWIPYRAIISININNKGWGELRIELSEFGAARVYEAYPTYVGEYVQVEIQDKTNRTFINNDTGEKTKVTITNYEIEKLIEGESTIKLANNSILSVSFYITDVSYSNAKD